jgi:hypothetical protein
MQGEQSQYLKLSGSWYSTSVGSWRHDYDSITPMKEEEEEDLSSVSIIEPLSVSYEIVAVIK